MSNPFQEEWNDLCARAPRSMRVTKAREFKDGRKTMRARMVEWFEKEKRFCFAGAMRAYDAIYGQLAFNARRGPNSSNEYVKELLDTYCTKTATRDRLGLGGRLVTVYEYTPGKYEHLVGAYEAWDIEQVALDKKFRAYEELAKEQKFADIWSAAVDSNK